MAIEIAHEMSNLEKFISVFETIEEIALQTSDPDEIRKALLAMPNFNIGDLSLDAEIYFVLAMRLIDSPRPDKETIERDGMTEQEIEADLTAISTLQQVIKTLGDSIDISYFEIQPEGDELQILRDDRTLRMQAAFRDLEV